MLKENDKSYIFFVCHDQWKHNSWEEIAALSRDGELENKRISIKNEQWLKTAMWYES